MSLIFGVFNRNGKPVEYNDLEKMYNNVSYFPHEKHDFKIVDNAGFGHMLTYNTPESLYEILPKYLSEQKLLFSAQGRIDNRKELADILNIRLTESLTDSELMLRSWMKWGKDSPDRLLGDWAFAVFDYRTQELFIARDHHGYTAINYYYDQNIFAFSSSIKSLFAINEIPKKLNQNKIIKLLTVWNGDNDQTFYENIQILPPANSLEINMNSFKVKRYWFPENIETDNNKKTNDCIEELNIIFNKAIKDRLRSNKPVASMLSGGLDSSTVSFIAADLLKKEGKKLTTYSHVPLHEPSKMIKSNKFGNEQPFIESIINASGNINPIYLNSDNITPLEGIIQLSNVLNGPIHAASNSYWIIDILKSSVKDGFGVLLTGENGNNTISFPGIELFLPYNTLIKKFGIKRATKKKILHHIINKYFFELYQKIKGDSLNIKDYSYINPKFAEKINLKMLMKDSGHSQSFFYKFTNSKEALLKSLRPGENLRCYYGGIMSNYFGIEERDPTADKRLIEYMLSIPNEMFFSEEVENKYILKRMMNNKLPDDVLYNKSKGLQSSDIGLRVINQYKEFDEIIDEITKLSYIQEIIDIDRLNNSWKKIKEVKSNNYDTSEINHLIRTIMIASFIKSF